MPIEFRCDQCQGVLQTADDTGGKQCQCPACGNIQTVPDVLSTGDGARAASMGSANPYQSPAATTWADRASAELPAIRPTVIDSADILSTTWQIFRSQFWLCTGAALVMGLCNGAFNGLVGWLIGIAMDNAGFDRRQLGSLLISQIGVQVPNLLVSTWLEGGLAMVMLRIARGQPAYVGDVFVVGRWYLPLLLARLMFWVMYLGGLIFCLVPGIILGLMFGQYFYLIIDRDMTISDAFDASRKIMAGNWGAVFVLYLASIPIAFLGLLACCVGVIPAGAYIMLMWPVAYLAMTGELNVEQPL